MHSQQAGLQYRKFLTDLSSSLFSFVLPLLPTSEERAVKEEVRGLIEKLVKTIEPSARLLSFGSSQNSFGLRNSDMDLVVLIDDPSANLEASHLVQMIGDLLLRETNFDVKPLPKARIPILKLTLAPSTALPYGIACDIGIENRLAIENTRLLLTYATIDPARVRTLVLFLKVWAKRRRINSPYRGTLSSYGFTLMVLYFLVHVKQPPVLPNLQRIAPLRPLSEHEVMLQGRNVYFFDDTETLRQEWSSVNYETVGELLIDFFRYYSHDFQFNNSVMSLRAGQLTKESKGWVNDIDVGGLNEMARDRNRLCIEDPFEVTYNVARTVTKDGLYTLRGEFMRATRILTQRPDRAVTALAELCRDREEEVRIPRSSSPAPRAISQSRSAFNTPNANGGGQPWRSQSQTPHERHPGATFESIAPGAARRGRHSEGGGGEPAPMQDYTAQDQWLASQGSNLGNVNPGGLGLGFEEYLMDYPTAPGDGTSGAGAPGDRAGRGRDLAARGLETPGGFGSRTPGRSATYEHAGSGSISAPLSPHRLYAQLEMNRPQVPPVWPNAAFDKLHAAPGAVAPPASGSYIPNPHRSVSQGSQGQAIGHTPEPTTFDQDPPSPLPAFAPFSPPAVPSLLKPLNGEPASYISPSTLLSPANQGKALSGMSPTSPISPSSIAAAAGAGNVNGPSGEGSTARRGQNAQDAINGLTDKFGEMGVAPPGSGAENPAAARKEETSGTQAAGEGEGGIGASGPAPTSASAQGKGRSQAI